MIGVRNSSSYGVKKDNVLLSDKKSFHAYIIVVGATPEYVKDYVLYLEDRAWELGYGHIEISKSGSLMKRQVFDSAVFSPERLVFEAKPTLGEGITQDQGEAKVFTTVSGLDSKTATVLTIARDLTAIPKPMGEGEKVYQEARRNAQTEADVVKEQWRSTKVEVLVETGVPKEKAEQSVSALIDRNELDSTFVLYYNNGAPFTVQDIANDPDRFDGMYICDPVEPEAGASKAIINTRPLVIHSFLHGGGKYVLTIRATHALVTSTQIQKRSASNVITSSDILEINFPDVQKDKNGKIIRKKSTLTNLKVLLDAFKIEIWYDEMTKQQHVRFNQQMLRTDDRANTSYAVITDLCVKQDLPKSCVNDYLPAIMDLNSYNPLVAMCQGGQWDGIDRVAALVQTIKTNDDAKYVQVVLMKWLVQCVAAWTHAFGSGVDGALPRFENVLVFVGAQGLNKTMFFENLLPLGWKEYVHSGAHLDISNKDSVKLAISAGITEMGELESTFKKDVGRIKAFLSLSDDKMRLPYARSESSFPRRTSFCATVNDTEFLVDDTGNRRFWPISIDEIDFDSFEKIDKMQLWYQVYALYLNGERWWIEKRYDEEVYQILEQKHAEHAVIEPADEVAISVIELTRQHPERAEWKTATDIASHFGLSKTGKKAITILKKRLLKEEIEFQSRTKKFKVTLFAPEGAGTGTPQIPFLKGRS